MRLYAPGGTLMACPQCHRVHSAWSRIPSLMGAIWYCKCGADAPYPAVLASEAVLAGRLVVPHDDWGGEPLPKEDA